MAYLRFKRRNPNPLPIYSDYSDQDLLSAVRNDDDEAFTELFRRYLKKAYSMAYSRVRSRETSQEIVQNIFISLWDKRSTVSIHNMSSYLFTAIKYQAINIIESRIVHQKYWDYYKNFIPQQDEVTEKTVQFNELMQVIEEGMDRLPEKAKTIFKLNRLEGRSVHEIANILNLSEKAIQYHLTRSVKEIRLHLKDYLISLSFILTAFFDR